MTPLEIALLSAIGTLLVGGALFAMLNPKTSARSASIFAPTKTPAISFAPPVATSSGGLFANPIVYMLGGFLLAGMLFYFMDRRDFVPVPPNPTPGPVLTLAPAFETNNNRAEAQFHARVFGTICTSLADVIEYDSKLSTPRIETGVDIDNLRRAMREYRMKGASFMQKYPELSPALDRYFKGILGSVGGGGKLTPDVRLKWISAFRGIAAATEQVNK